MHGVCFMLKGCWNVVYKMHKILGRKSQIDADLYSLFLDFL